MTRRRRIAGAVVAASLLALADPAIAEVARGARTGPAGEIELAAQTAVVPTDGTFAVRLGLPGVPTSGSVRMVVHQRVRSRSELALSMEGEDLRTEVFDNVAPIASLPVQSDGTRRLALPVAPLSLPEGVYPVELIAQDPDFAEIDREITHLVVAPEEGDDAPPLGVAVVADISAPPAFEPDGTVTLSRPAVEGMAGVVTGLVAAGDVPVTIAARPETIEALLGSSEPGDAELVEAVRAAAADRTVLALPYAEVSPDALAPAGLLGELGTQAERGRQVLADALGVDPVDSVWLAADDLGADGLAALAFLGGQRVVVADDQVEPLGPGIIGYSLAQPFQLTPPAEAPDAPAVDVQALAVDPVVMERLDTDGTPGLVASRVLAELALLRLEQPSVARSVVIPLERSTPTEVVALVLAGLGSGRPFAPMPLDEAFAHAGPVLDGGGNVVERALVPAAVDALEPADGRALRAAREHLGTFAGLVGEDSPLTDPMERHLLLATATGVSDARRQDHIDAVDAAIAAVTSEVSTPATFTLTLAARDGTIPLTIRNDSGLPLRVAVHLRSPRLEFPDGDTIPLVLTEPSTRIDIPVRARTSGAFPLQVEVMTPDGEQQLSATRYTVRSTAVSGAGLILSVGAGAFLVVWWARHWRRTRRSARLVAAHAHPTATEGH